MKKIVTIIMAAALILSVGTTSAFAAGRNYVDANSDGVCDNYGTRGNGNGNGLGLGFVDEDGDGVCDNRGSGRGNGNGNGAGRGNGYGRQMGRNR